MAIATEVTFYERKWNQATDPYTKSLDCTGCSVLYVALYTNQAQDVSSMSYAGSAMTHIATVNGADSYDLYVYRIENPTTGANNVSIDFTAACSYFHAIGIGLSGTNTSSPEGAQETSFTTSTSTDHDESITTQYDNSWVLDFLATTNDMTFSATSGQTIDIQSGSPQGFATMIGHLLVATAGATNTNYDSSVAKKNNRVTLEVRVSGAAPSGPAHLKTWNGIAKANIKTINGIAIANIKTISGVD